jgi:glucose dehydrogenase
MSDERDPRIDDAFKQLDGALCLWARAKGETPMKQYIHEVTPDVRRVLVGDVVFIVTPANDK